MMTNVTGLITCMFRIDLRLKCLCSSLLQRKVKVGGIFFRRTVRLLSSAVQFAWGKTVTHVARGKFTAVVIGCPSA